MQIEVSFEIWKRLTALLVSERDTYDAAVSRLLDGISEQSVIASCDRLSAPVEIRGEGAFYKNVFLPDGTELRATYRGRTYLAKIVASRWIDLENNEPRNSPSQAAFFITGSGVNGWRFWLVRRPEDGKWQTLDSLRSELAR
jgi:hypothetical protein